MTEQIGTVISSMSAAVELSTLAAILLLCRVAGFLSVVPIVGDHRIPKLVKVGLAMSLTFVLHSRISRLPTSFVSGLDDVSWSLLCWLSIRESLIGVLIGTLLNCLYFPIRMCGSLITQELGLTIASLTSSVDGGQTNLLSEIFDTLFLLGGLVANVHFIFLTILSLSLDSYPPFAAWTLPDWRGPISILTRTIESGIVISFPVIVPLAMTSVTIMFAMRQAPQFNLFSFGLPLRLLVGLFVLLVFVPDVFARAVFEFDRQLTQIMILLGGGQ